MGEPRIVLVANDVVPGMGLPVAAPGLRVHGLAEGMRAHGFEVVTAVDGKALSRLRPGGTPPALPAGAFVVDETGLGAFLAGQAPAVVVMTNSNQIDRWRPAPGLHLVVDLFAPKVLELAGSPEGRHRERALAALRERKLRALAAAEGCIVNGAGKVPYFQDWLRRAGRDPATTPMEVVLLGVPAHFPPPRPPAGPVRLVVAGYLQGWSVPGPWLDRLVARLDPPRAALDLVLPVHWGQRSRHEAAARRLEALAAQPGVTVHGMMPWDDFPAFMGRADAAVDLFARTPERELAVVTRTLVALACGVPVVHPPFTEVSPLVEACDAGWLVDPADEAALDRAFDAVLGDPGERAAKAAGARRLWAEHLDPRVAAAPLARLARRLLGGG